MTREPAMMEYDRRAAPSAQGAREALLFLVEVLGEGAYEANVDGRLSPDDLKLVNSTLSKITATVEGLVERIYT